MLLKEVANEGFILKEDDAADSFATIALLDAGSEFSINVLVQAARGLFPSDRRDRKQGEEQRVGF